MTAPDANMGERAERRTLAAATTAHALHDGYTDLLYLLLPIWQAEFGLGYAEVGALRSSYTATMAALQIPSSLLATRVSPILVLAGGAAGKLVCGTLGARFGVLTTVLLTEGSTAAGMVALLALPLDVVRIVLPLVGVALNGTSSVLYGTVPELVPPEACARAFGIFYTGTIAASALAPPLLGLFADRMGVSNAIVGIALAVALNPLLSREP